MNIVQLHYKAEFFLDSVRSPRFNNDKMDEALNSAINDIILDRYNNIRAQPKEYAFQTSQRLRDELATIVKKSSVMTAATDTIPKTQFPSDYMLLLNMKANVSGTWINTIPVTYDELNILELNPYTKPKISYPERTYRIENESGVMVVWGEIGALISAEMYYVATPTKVDIGNEVNTPGDTTLLSDYDSVIAYVDSTVQAYNPTKVFSIKKGEKYVIGTYSEDRIALLSGILFRGFTETDLPELLHEEIARKAAKILSGNVENYDRDMSLEKDIKNTEN